MKDIEKMLKASPSLAKEFAKLLKEEMDLAAEDTAAEVTALTQVQGPAGTNDNEVVPEAPSVTPTNAEVAGEGHSVDPEYTAEDPITPEMVDEMVDEVPVEDLESETEALEEVRDGDVEEIDELDKVIEEAMNLKAKLQNRIVFTEGVINKLNARMLTEAARLIAGRKSLNEGKKK